MSALGAVLARASVGLFFVMTAFFAVGETVLVALILPRPQKVARHNHWLIVGLGVVALVAALVVHIYR